METLDFTIMQYSLLSEKNILSLDNGITDEKIEKLAEISERDWKSNNPMRNRLINSFMKMMRDLFARENYLNWLVLAMYSFILVIIFTRRNIELLYTILFLIIGRCFAWMYVLYQGRFPERIATALFMIEAFCLYGIIMSYSSYFAMSKRKLLIIGIGTLSVLTIYNLFGLIGIRETARENQYNCQIWKELNQYCQKHENDFFVMGTGTLLYYGEPQFGRIDSVYQNYVVLGSWYARTPLERQKLKNAGIHDLEKAIIDGQVYLMFEDGALDESSYLIEYFENKYTDFKVYMKEQFKAGDKLYAVYQFGAD